MSAKDYQICPALFKAYLAKVSKKNPCLMTNDRREITEEEILTLIDWYLDKELREDYKDLSFDSSQRDGFRVVLKYKKKE